MSTDEEAGGWRLVAVVLGSVALACLVLSIGLEIVQASVEFGSGDGYEQLGEILLALIATLAVGIIALVIAVVVGVRRTVPPGHRLSAVAVVLVAVAAVVAALIWTGANTRRAELDALAPIVPLLVLVAAAAAIGAVAGLLPRRPVVALVAAVSLSLGVVVVAVEQRADVRIARDQVERFERTGAPLALIDGTHLDAWGDPYVVGSPATFEPGVGYVRAEYDVGGAGRLVLVFDPVPDPYDCGADQCLELGRRADGAPILGRRDWGSLNGQGVDGDVWVDVAGGQWRVHGWEGYVHRESVVAVLQELEPVDAATFVAAT